MICFYFHRRNVHTIQEPHLNMPVLNKCKTYMYIDHVDWVMCRTECYCIVEASYGLPEVKFINANNYEPAIHLYCDVCRGKLRETKCSQHI